MQKDSRIVVTGAAGFIGSCLVGYLNEKGFSKIVLVDDFSRKNKLPNLEKKRFSDIVERNEFFEWLFEEKPKIDFFFHLGARTDTTEFNYSIHQKLNVEYSKKVWDYCTVHEIPLIYASSAATYGNGELGYNDDNEVINILRPLNPYGVSKNEFDKWVIHQRNHPPFWAGLKFFNVYGPNEYHKGRMASVIFQAYQQIKKTGAVELFRSHHKDYKDGEQLRDFIYVKDILKVAYWMMEHRSASGIYNVGTGRARSFADLAASTFGGLDILPKISFVDMPDDIRFTYQYFTEAKMDKLRNIGYTEAFYTLEEGVDDYVRHYLARDRFF